MRLIDADKLLRFFTVDTANQTYRFGTIKKQIENAETVQAIPIPNNATNGDIILTMFDTATVYGIDKENDYITICIDNNFYQKFRYSWWNAQYKRGNENDSN